MSENNLKKTKSNKKYRPRKRKNKLVITFDEKARREFLTGFHKRKVQRQNKAKQELEEQLKLERKRIKAEAKEQYKKLLLSQKPIPELSDLLSENIDMGTHSVSVTELSAADLARKNNWIGINEVQYERENEEELKNTQNDSKQKDKLEGMDVNQRNKKKSRNNISSNSCKEIKRQIKQQATLNVKNSRVFKKKAQLEKIKNIKLKKKQEKKLEKLKRKQKNTKKNKGHCFDKYK